MLKSTLSNAGLWICPNTGHAINLEEPAAFNAQVESFLAAVERGSWRRRYLSTPERSEFVSPRYACANGSAGQVDQHPALHLQDG
jgi:hypothetical protein